MGELLGEGDEAGLVERGGGAQERVDLGGGHPGGRGDGGHELVRRRAGGQPEADGEAGTGGLTEHRAARTRSPEAR